MNEERVIIPVGTLVHVGGMPFRLTGSAVAQGRASNLALGLEALAEDNALPAANNGALSAAQQVRAMALVLVDDNPNAVTESVLGTASNLFISTT